MIWANIGWLSNIIHLKTNFIVTCLCWSHKFCLNEGNDNKQSLLNNWEVLGKQILSNIDEEENNNQNKVQFVT